MINSCFVHVKYILNLLLQLEGHLLLGYYHLLTIEFEDV